jgi:hypothetical protein
MTSRAPSARKKRPRVGEPRKTRQPLKIDKLPQKWRDQIQKYRAQGCTWVEIEELSRGFDWDKQELKVLELFPEMKIPESNLIRWYDLRVEQVTRETLARSEQARELAKAFAGADLSKTDEAVVNALRDTIFAEMQKAGSASRPDLIAALTNLGVLLTEVKKNEIRERKVKVDELAAELAKRKTDAALQKFEKASEDVKRKLEKGKSVTLADLNSLRERTFGLPPLQPASGS